MVILYQIYKNIATYYALNAQNVYSTIPHIVGNAVLLLREYAINA